MIELQEDVQRVLRAYRERTLPPARSERIGAAIEDAFGSAAAPVLPGPTASRAIRWTVLGLGAALAIGGAALAMRGESTAPVPAPGAAPVPVPAPTLSMRMPMRAVHVTPPAVPDRAPVAVPVEVSAPPRVRREAPPPATERPSSLAEELALIDEAEAHLRGGRARECLRVLARHRQRYHPGTLADEAEILRARAECALGQAEGARARMATFIADHPGSALIERARTICRAP
jgi:hypothetical protein